jgi:hypothetical protein
LDFFNRVPVALKHQLGRWTDYRRRLSFGDMIQYLHLSSEERDLQKTALLSSLDELVAEGSICQATATNLPREIPAASVLFAWHTARNSVILRPPALRAAARLAPSLTRAPRRRIYYARAQAELVERLLADHELGGGSPLRSGGRSALESLITAAECYSNSLRWMAEEDVVGEVALNSDAEPSSGLVRLYCHSHAVLGLDTGSVKVVDLTFVSGGWTRDQQSRDYVWFQNVFAACGEDADATFLEPVAAQRVAAALLRHKQRSFGVKMQALRAVCQQELPSMLCGQNPLQIVCS